MEFVAGVSEVIGWVGLLGAIPFALLALIFWLIRGSWRTATAVVVDGEVRWFGDGDFHAAPAEGEIPDTEHLDIYYRAGRPGAYHLERVAHDERTYRFLAILLAAIGVVALVVSTVASFV